MIKECPSTSCALYEFRFGTNPFLKKEMTPEQRMEAGERLRKARMNRGSGQRESQGERHETLRATVEKNSPGNIPTAQENSLPPLN